MDRSERLTEEERVAVFQERLDRLCRAHKVRIAPSVIGVRTIQVFDAPVGTRLGAIPGAGYER